MHTYISVEFDEYRNARFEIDSEDWVEVGAARELCIRTIDGTIVCYADRAWKAFKIFSREHPL